jgi:lysylphosphatidylglycerol synthetase-like protein (DUF2156 family)
MIASPESILENVANTTIVFGVLLIALGLSGYFGTGRTSLTALIPAAFGIALAGLGAMARDAAKRKMAMHIAAVLGLIGYLACIPGLFKLPLLMAHQEVPRPAAVISQSIMAFLTAIFVVLCVRSFRAAQKLRQKAKPAQ